MPGANNASADTMLQSYSSSGVLYYKKNVILTLTGDEEWSWNKTNPDSVYAFYPSPTGLISTINPICNFAIYGSTGNNPSESRFNVYNQNGSDKIVNICFRNAAWVGIESANTENLEAFRQKLRDLRARDTPVKIIYNLRTPVSSILSKEKFPIHSYSPGFTATTTNAIKPILYMQYAVR